MKKSSSSVTARVLLGLPFLMTGMTLLVLSTIYGGNRATIRGPQRLVAPALSVPQQFNGTYDPSVFPCSTTRHHFAVPIGQARIVVQVSAQVPTNDLTLNLLFGPDPNPVLVHTEDTGTSNEVYAYQPAGGVPAGEYQVQICQTPTPNGVPQMPPYNYTGTFTYDDTAAGGNPPNFGALPPAPQDSGPKVGYENFEPPAILTPVKVTSSGGLTVEYLGRNAIEPSIGANWSSGVINYKCDLEMLFIDFANSCSANGNNAIWINRPATTSVFVDSDPIGFTDRQTHRVFSSELTLLGPNTVKNAHSDDDGVTWTVDQTGGIASAVDHQTIGGGPYRSDLNAVPPVVPPPHPAYANAVYYCSQNLGADAVCSRSDNGGLTYGPSIPIYAEVTCGGLHGHLKVAPDGTVYVPNKGCGGIQAVVVSEDNGVTWAPRVVKTDTQAAAPPIVGVGDDPAVAIDAAGRTYFAFSNFGGGAGAGAGVAISDDHGVTWKNMFDIGAIYGVKNVCFPTATAGDAGRAAIAFYGSTTPQGPVATGGDSNKANFKGVWHLYIAHTFDGGKTWTTSDATPTFPMQRSGLLRGGGADIVRNLADFYDMTIDKDGRVLVGYGNGCAGANCAQAPIAADGTSLVKGNAYSATATIARQSSGRRMLAAKDPASPTQAPGMPSVTALRIGNMVRLMWNEADSGNSMINNYQILRGTASGAETFLTTVAGTQTGGTFNDTTATDVTKTYYYKVVAVNSAGASCPNNEIPAPYVGDNCTGIILHKNDPSHPESTGGTAGQPPLPTLLIDYISVGEGPGSNDLVFKMKVGNLNNPLPPNSRWRIAWDWFVKGATDPEDIQMWYVGMATDATSTVTFEYGTIADAGVPAVLILQETKVGDLPQGPTLTHYDTDGTITMRVPKSSVGSPQAGDLLGAIAGKTITGDAADTKTFQRSTAFVDHTFIKGQADNTYPPATYTLVGNTSCSSGTIVPVSAVSRKTHSSAGDFNIDLPLTGAAGIECRVGPVAGEHKVVVTFAAPVTVTGASLTLGSGGATGVVSGQPTVNGSQVTVNLANVSNAQLLAVNLIGVSDGVNSGNVAIPMGVLLGDANGISGVTGSDVNECKAKVGADISQNNFRYDVDVSGAFTGSDVNVIKSRVGSTLPP